MNEFKNDPIMRELHEYRKRNYNKTKNLSFKQIKKQLNERIDKNLKNIGFKLIENNNGKFKLETINK